MIVFSALHCTDRFTDLDQLNLVKLAYGGLVLKATPFSQLSQDEHCPNSFKKCHLFRKRSKETRK